MEQAVLAGGCFWCLEAAFQQLKGVERVQSGYAGGHVDQPSYHQVCGGDTGHAEVVRIDFDPAVIGYRDLLDVFFTIHDPTTKDRQGHDIGPQYRSAIFHVDESQRRMAEEAVRDWQDKGVWPGRFVTELAPLTRFWPAEAEHDDYFARHPQQPYCQAVVAPKVAKVRHHFMTRLRA